MTDATWGPTPGAHFTELWVLYIALVIVPTIIIKKNILCTYLVRALKEWLKDLEPSFSRTCIKTSSLSSGNV